MKKTIAAITAGLLLVAGQAVAQNNSSTVRVGDRVGAEAGDTSEFAGVPIAVLLVTPPGWHRSAVLTMCAIGAIPAIGYSYALMEGRGTASPDSYYIAFGVEGAAGVLGVLYVVSTCGALLLSGLEPLIAWGSVNAVAVSALVAWNSLGLPALWCLWAAVTSGFVAWFLRKERPQEQESDWVAEALRPRGLRP